MAQIVAWHTLPSRGIEIFVKLSKNLIVNQMLSSKEAKNRRISSLKVEDLTKACTPPPPPPLLFILRYLGIISAALPVKLCAAHLTYLQDFQMATIVKICSDHA